MLNHHSYISIAVSSVIMYRVGAAAPSIRISISPSQGPFRVGQTVQFTCEVEPAQVHPVTYQWRIRDGENSLSNSESIDRTFGYYSFRYCWYFCAIMLNGTKLGSANKLIEVQGKY